MSRLGVGLAALCLAVAPAVQAQELDETLVVLTWYRLTGRTPDFDRAAGFAEPVRRASQFDRPETLRAEVTRLQSALQAADPGREFSVRVNDHVSQYDHDRGEFTIQLFTEGTYLPLRVFNEEYQLVFANAAGGRAIAMPRDTARAFDLRLNRTGRRVTSEVRFRVIGAGDPTGAVSGDRVIRAEILAARLLDDAGAVVHVPNFQPAATVAEAAPASFDPLGVDVAGFRIGVRGKDLEATLTRLYGKADRTARTTSTPKGVAATIEVNSMGCMKLVGRRNNPTPGAVCVVAYVDEDDVVRMVRVQRLFPWLDLNRFRQALVGKYGPVDASRGGYGMMLGWGAEVDGRWLGGQARSGIHALRAVAADETSLDERMGNRIGDLLLTLELTDVDWVARQVGSP